MTNIWAALRGFFAKVPAYLDVSLIDIKGTSITLWMVVYVIIASILLFIATRITGRMLISRLLSRSRYDRGVRDAIGRIFQYIANAIGLIIILQSTGMDFTALTVVAGAVGVGVGFGLQNIANNFISGIIILVERPIKVGDRVEVGEVEGEVVNIGLRSTMVLTNDDISIIVPNSRFISENVVNWSHRDARIRFKIPVGVAYGSDAEAVTNTLLKVAEDHEDVLDSPAPGVRLAEFGDSSIKFELLVWTSRQVHRPGRMRSELNYAIYNAFQENGIHIPIPQRDVYLHRQG